MGVPVSKLFTSSNHQPTDAVTGEYCELDGEFFFQISNVHKMEEFFVSLVSAFDHWMFITSRGALTAGRTNIDSSLFPYYCADKLIDGAESTGPKTIIRVQSDHGVVNWEPFTRDANRGHDTTQTLWKSLNGNKIVFEETHQSLGLSFRYRWTVGDRFGFIRNCVLTNHSAVLRSVSILDGIENVLPARIDPTFQLRFSNLGDAYKKSERLGESELGIYYLSSIPSDRAEPSEGLRANIVWSSGLDSGELLLSSRQVERFRRGEPIDSERDVRGVRGAFFRSSVFELSPHGSKEWNLVAALDLDQTDLANFSHELSKTEDVENELNLDIRRGDEELSKLIASADGIQLGRQVRRTHRHRSNVIFNIMRGGIPYNGYQIPHSDFVQHVEATNREVFQHHRDFLNSMSPSTNRQEWVETIEAQNDPSLLRVAMEYLPLTFSRRHGDPTRPWNQFSINIADENGERLFDYEGNWRDIFQNWEALLFSFPQFAPNMVCRFLNASTADGYNPYRITKQGIEWEKLDPSDPWSNIGYWGDHQIVYLLKLLQRARQFCPRQIDQWLERECFSFADVPYRIKDYQQILENGKDTIEYDADLDEQQLKRVDELGSDGKLLATADGRPIHASMMEKLFLPAMAKLSNFVPEGGIWLNTQRPEWNDANNALVGNGLSVVTTCALRQYLVFLHDWISHSQPSRYRFSENVARWLDGLSAILKNHSGALQTGFTDRSRRALVDDLSQSGSDYRNELYQSGMSETKTSVSRENLIEFCETSRRFLDQTIQANQRDDLLYHAYNLVEFGPESAGVHHLPEMLEGQVAVLDSGLLSSSQAVEVLDALRNSKMYRQDQRSYMLYPDRELPRFVEKNKIATESVEGSPLLTALVAANNHTIIRVDADGGYHFNGDLRNSSVLKTRLQTLRADDQFREQVDLESDSICQLYETAFNHQTFTGRSGTFFAYEGLGSIYWHMVSKLRLAVANYLAAARVRDGFDAALTCDAETALRLQRHYDELSDGIGAEKSPQEYGAFPIDPYSHTPSHAGAQQPGMTGQVKEDILARFVELGVRVEQGVLSFDPGLFDHSELLETPQTFRYLNVGGDWVETEILPGEFVFTLCQVPILYRQGNACSLTVYGKDETDERPNLSLTPAQSAQIFSRDDSIRRLIVELPAAKDPSA